MDAIPISPSTPSSQPQPTRQTGSILNRRRQNHIVFDSYGNITSQTNPGSGYTILYAGLIWDGDVALYRSFTRFYDASVARWTSEDPIGFAGGDANLARYVGNMPTAYVDPNGLEGQRPYYEWEPISAYESLYGPVNYGSIMESVARQQRAEADCERFGVIRQISPEQADRNYLIYLQSKPILSRAEMRELDRLMISQMTGFDRFLIVQDIAAAFAGGYVRPGGSLNVRGLKFPGRGIDFSTPSTGHHKNKLEYVGPTHVYAIRGPQGTHKIGESAQGLTCTFDTIRGAKQARELSKLYGTFYRAEVRAFFPDKASARAYETRYIQTFRRLFGKDSLPGNETDR